MSDALGEERFDLFGLTGSGGLQDVHGYVGRTQWQSRGKEKKQRPHITVLAGSGTVKVQRGARHLRVAGNNRDVG